jgi:hypothetical protein
MIKLAPISGFYKLKLSSNRQITTLTIYGS